MNQAGIYAERAYQRSSKDTEQLEKNVSDYPFSQLANFLLLYHYKKTNNSSFNSFAKKAVLSFPNPYWLQLLLYEEKKLIEEEVPKATQEKPLEFIEDKPEEFFPAQNIIDQNNESIDNEKLQEETIEANDIKDKDITKVEEQHNLDEAYKAQTNEHPTESLVAASLQKETIQTSENSIAFDPLHTIDYFASLGIHFCEEDIPANDKLGSQVKSFTAWLKSMKKLHPAKLEEQSLATEKQVQSLAEESNVNTDVLTEAMAEVLIKQNKKDKAIDMYNKLSLINPSKSAYFAAKIESIKQR